MLDCKTVRMFAYSSKREQSNKRSGTPRFADFRFWKPTVFHFSNNLHVINKPSLTETYALSVSLSKTDSRLRDGLNPTEFSVLTGAAKVKISAWHDILVVLKATRNFNYYSVKK